MINGHTDFCFGCARNRPAGGCLIPGVTVCPALIREIPEPIVLESKVDNPEPSREHVLDLQGQEWPRVVKMIAKRKVSSDRGVGDTLERLFSHVGGRQFKRVMELLSVECGCGDRQEWLNNTYPYPRQPTHRKFTTMNDLHAATLSLLKKLPPIRGVAGVPVSGLLVAPTIATLLHVPLYEVSEQHGLVQTGHGWRGCSRIADTSLPLLVVDDTVSSGRSIGIMRDRLKADGVHNCIFASSLCHGNSLDKVDLYGSQCDEPHLLEWNLANSGYMSTLGHHGLHGAGIVCDMDGVICQDPPRHFDETNDDDRTSYLNWLADAPLGTFLPRMHDVPVIVSWRCEYTRSLTEHWLRRHHIKYKRLVLWGDNSQTPAEQSASRTWQPLDHKGRILMEANYAMIVESCEHQSRAICEATGKPVLCWDTKEYFNPKI
jgi:orotate phosphoribosyltransferase